MTNQALREKFEQWFQEWEPKLLGRAALAWSCWQAASEITRKQSAEIAWEMQRKEGRSEIGNAITSKEAASESKPEPTLNEAADILVKMANAGDPPIVKTTMLMCAGQLRTMTKKAASEREEVKNEL